MFNMPSIKIGRFFGIPIEINPTWFIIFVLVAASLAFSQFPSDPRLQGWGQAGYLLAGIVSALLFFASIVFHELSHSLVAKAEGLKIERVTLFMFGGVAQMTEEPRTAGAEFRMAVAGPASSLVLAGVFFGLETLTRALSGPSWIWGPLAYLASVNLAVAVFNLLPGFPLDGGRVLRSILWQVTGDQLKATRWAARSGQVIGYSMVALAVFGVLQGNLGLIWFGLIGWFIAVLADSAYKRQVAMSRISGLTVRSAMSPSPTLAPGEITLEQLAHDYVLGGQHSRYPVILDGQVIGLVSLSRVKQVPREQWGALKVADIADRDIAALVIEADAPLESALPRLAGEWPGALLVLQQGHLVGILTRSDLVRILSQPRA